MRKLLLSVVIPTKNRYNYLRYLISKLTEAEGNEFEVIIQDNSDDNTSFCSYLNSLNDKRILYNYTSQSISLNENCEMGVSIASGEYICMIGDDDGILLANTLKVCNYLLKHDINAAIFRYIDYAWPDVYHAIWGNYLAGKIIVPKFSYSFRTLYSESELYCVISRSAALGMQKLPRLYHGLVKKEILESLKNDLGKYFPGPSPDMANAVALTKYVTKYSYVDVPCIISGYGKKSAAGLGSEKKHNGAIELQGTLPRDTLKNWSFKVPKFWSGPTINSESARIALLTTGREKMLTHFYYLYAVCFLFERTHWRYTFQTVLNNCSKFEVIKILFISLGILFKRTLNLFKNIYIYKIRGRFIYAKNISDVIEKLSHMTIKSEF